jgi:hypothetical protein
MSEAAFGHDGDPLREACRSDTQRVIQHPEAGRCEELGSREFSPSENFVLVIACGPSFFSRFGSLQEEHLRFLSKRGMRRFIACLFCAGISTRLAGGDRRGTSFSPSLLWARRYEWRVFFLRPGDKAIAVQGSMTRAISAKSTTQIPESVSLARFLHILCSEKQHLFLLPYSGPAVDNGGSFFGLFGDRLRLNIEQDRIYS